MSDIERDYRAGEREGQKGNSDKFKKIEIFVAIVAVAVSIAGLVWAMKSAAEAKRSAAEANRIAAEYQKSTQARKVSFYVNWQTAKDESRIYYVRIVNLSPSLLSEVYITYGPTSTPQYYVHVGAIQPCGQWEAEEEQQFWLRIYFKDAAGNYWEIDQAYTLQSLSAPVKLSDLTDKTSAWDGGVETLSCAP